MIFISKGKVALAYTYAAAAAAKSLQSCPTLCNPIDAQAAKKGGGYLAALSCQNLWLSCCVGLFMGTLWKKSLVFWN